MIFVVGITKQRASGGGLALTGQSYLVLDRALQANSSILARV